MMPYNILFNVADQQIARDTKTRRELNNLSNEVLERIVKAHIKSPVLRFFKRASLWVEDGSLALNPTYAARTLVPGNWLKAGPYVPKKREYEVAKELLATRGRH